MPKVVSGYPTVANALVGRRCGRCVGGTLLRESEGVRCVLCAWNPDAAGDREAAMAIVASESVSGRKPRNDLGGGRQVPHRDPTRSHGRRPS